MTQTNALLHLNFSVHQNRTLLRVLKQEPPLRVVRAFAVNTGDQAQKMPGAEANGSTGHNGSGAAKQIQPALVHLHNVSGGLLGGDQLHMRAAINAGAQAQLTTTGATRVYRQRVGYPITTQTTHLTVAQNGLLEYLPDALIPYARSQYRQATRIELMDGAGLFYWEVITPGREAKGERFKYDLLQIELDIVANGQPIVVERNRLEPRHATFNTAVRLSEYPYFATFYICQAGIDKQTWRALEMCLDEHARAISVPGQMLWGVSALAAHGVSVRAVGVSSHAIQQHLPCFWQLAKQALYQQDAIMPRKIH